uniref:Carrier domain-containing protein n=1 Tax=uncultured Thiotrichaceae bacterium TaxID=298394 RepID=A0A6S6T7U5_9GAMM|nr:MAG: Unknown protein [uncultured Thiotrichaceae bacterium]
MYRSGDLGVINENGDIEYRGRIDLQVKIRGYRIELTEIESALLQLPEIEQVVVVSFEPTPGVKELAAYYTLRSGAEITEVGLSQYLKQQLPAYMVPAFYQQLDIMPMLASDKVDRKGLPALQNQRLSGNEQDLQLAETATEKVLAAELGTLLGLNEVSVHADFFAELGANSLLMARYSAAVRQQLNRKDLCMRDIYEFPTITQLAGHLDAIKVEPLNDKAEKTQTTGNNTNESSVPNSLHYYGCGALQLLFYVLSGAGLIWAGTQLLPWVIGVESVVDVYFRTIMVFAGVFLFLVTLPVAAKWLLIGRWQVEAIPVWSLRYYRFWLVKQLLAISPLNAFRGYPLYNVYLRLLGAKIGKNVVLACKHTPVATDLLSVGDNTLLRADSTLLSYKACAQTIFTGTVHLGNDVVVGEGSSLDINTRMEDGSQLGHASALHEDQVIPAGQAWHGSPARVCDSDFRFQVNMPCSQLRKIVYSLVQILLPMVIAPLGIGVMYLLVSTYGLPVYEPLSVLWSMDILLNVSVVFVVSFILGLLTIGLLPRLLNNLLEEGKDYPLYGVHYYIFRWVKVVSNNSTFNNLFGDSSLVVPYLKWVGYRFGTVVQTGSNFGTTQSHHIPFLSYFGSRTMVSDGLSLLNMSQSNTAFRLCRVTIGGDTFLGNSLYYPSTARVGDNCLIATKTQLPIDGQLRENTGLLGSPAFEIPRNTGEDMDFDPYAEDVMRQQALPLKLRSNVSSMLLLLSAGFLGTFMVVLLIYAVTAFHLDWGVWGWMSGSVLLAASAIGFGVLFEWAALEFSRMRPTTMSIYDRGYWRVERYWKFNTTALFAGTPFRALVLRLMGVRVGKKVFDDGVQISEKTLIEIGDYCTLSASSILQAHSLEQGRFKSDYIRIGNHCTLAANSFIHYGVHIADHAQIAIDSFVMKGEQVAAGEYWGGNPARVMAEKR